MTQSPMPPSLHALLRCLNRRHRLAPPLLALVVTAGAGAQAPALDTASAPAAAPRAEQARALERCEASVTETLRKLRGNDADSVQFVAAQRAVTVAEDGEMGVRGAGRYRGRSGGGTSFTFTCSYSTKTGLASGVLLRESGGPGPEAWQPDLSRISPDACESAVAQLLTEKHPRVARIALEPDTRRLQPGPDHHVLLLGQGAVQRAAGMNAVPFSYACELDPRNGRVVGVKTSV
ncbi:MAG: hypothetical protein KIT17_16115 [Rubrivivax sp.]|nr:hypothetical protein [Rubrivivax sp.]